MTDEVENIIWIEANGTKPADPAPEGHVSLIAVNQRGGGGWSHRQIDHFLWEHDKGPHDIVSWRVVGTVKAEDAA